MIKIILLCAVLPYFISGIIYYVYFRFVKHIKPKKSAFPKHKRKKQNIFYRLWVKLPERFILDTLKKNPDEFPFSECGLYIWEGEQGAGKTISMTRHIMQQQNKYPALQVLTNYNYKKQNEEFTDWSKQMLMECGETGAIFAIDEIHVWLMSSLESKNFPPHMLNDTCQNRKNHRAIYGTVQVFSRCPKPIREQTKLLYTPITLLGCLTIVIKRKPDIDHDTGTIKSLKFRGIEFYVHSDELRNSYNTLDVIQKMQKSGFVRDNDNIIKVETATVAEAEEKKKETIKTSAATPTNKKIVKVKK